MPFSRIYIAFLTVLLCFGLHNLTFAQETDQYKIRKVVLDAGHGGHDPGCHGAHSNEKHVTLAIALKVGEYIEKNIPEVEVIYTRKTDKFVELFERAAIANRANADLFISIHCNAIVGSAATHGTETYVMGLNKTEANLNVSKRENAVILMEDDYKANYDGFDPNSPESHIMFSLFQDAFLDQSINIATKIEDQFKNRAGRRSRGVKQAAFVVLFKTSMASVLIETGFLTNRNEENFLSSEEGQSYIASAVYRAFKEWKMESDGKIPDDLAGPDSNLRASTDEAALEKEASEKEAPDVVVKEEVEIKSEEPVKASVVFRIQVRASKNLLPESDPFVQRYSDISIEETESGWHRYMVGEHTNYQDALTNQITVKKDGYRDAFIVAYKDGKRIPIREVMNVGE